MPDKSEKPIACASRMFSNTKEKYSQIQKERLAIIFPVNMFDQFTYGRHFLIQTDRKLLLGLLAKNKPIQAMITTRIQRSKLSLSEYGYTLSYPCGHQNSNADCMSRLKFNLEKETEYRTYPYNFRGSGIFY